MAALLDLSGVCARLCRQPRAAGGELRRRRRHHRQPHRAQRRRQDLALQLHHRLLQAAAAAHRFDGAETLPLKPYQVTRAGIARTFQNVRLFRQMSVLENVMSGQHCRTRAGAIGAILRLPSQRREEARDPATVPASA